jgi:hypothetical protein
MYKYLLMVAVLLAFSTGTVGAQKTYTYSKTVQQACASDYHKHCGEYGIETEALRLCMDRSGHSLSKTCVNALVDAGEVSKDAVERRKRLGH